MSSRMLSCKYLLSPLWYRLVRFLPIRICLTNHSKQNSKYLPKQICFKNLITMTLMSSYYFLMTYQKLYLMKNRLHSHKIKETALKIFLLTISALFLLMILFVKQIQTLNNSVELWDKAFLAWLQLTKI